MDIVEMLDACKDKLGLSDYGLAKEFKVSPSRIYGYRAGREHPEVYVCFRIAEILDISPSKVIAQVEAKTTRNPDKALFFQRFFMIAALWITLGLPLGVYSGSTGSAYAAGLDGNNLINQHNGTLCEMRLRCLKRLLRGLITDIYDKFVAYFTCNWHVKSAAPT